MTEVWCFGGFLQEAESSNLHTASETHENSVMAMVEQPYSMIVKSCASFPSTDKWDNTPLSVRSFHSKGKILPQGGCLNCSAPAASDLAFNTPYVEGELFSYDDFFFFAGILNKEV